MTETILIGRGDAVERTGAEIWRRGLAGAWDHCQERMRFMTPEHHRVREYAVRELPRHGRPLTPEVIARGVDLPLPRVREILAELERHLFFLVRNAAGAVSWAYTVTTDPTPHRLSFSSGETLYGA